MIEIVMWLIHIWDTLIYMRDTCAHVRQIIVISQTPSSNCHELYHVSVTNWDTLIHMWDTYWLKGHSCMWETWRQWMHHVTHMDECLTWRCLSHVTIWHVTLTWETPWETSMGETHWETSMGGTHWETLMHVRDKKTVDASCLSHGSVPEASWRRGFDPCTPLVFDLYHYLDQKGYFWLVPGHAPGPSSQVLPSCRVRHPCYSKKLFVRWVSHMKW